MDYPLANPVKFPYSRWILFTQKVDSALNAAGISTGSAVVSKQFASSLKDIKPYEEWTDDDIVEAWSTWEKPEQSKSGKAKAEEKLAVVRAEAEAAAAEAEAALEAARKVGRGEPPASLIAVLGAREAAMRAEMEARMAKHNTINTIWPGLSRYVHAKRSKNRAENALKNAAEQKAVRNLNARESERAANLIFPRQNQTRRKPTWGIPNVGPGFGGSRKRKPLRKRRRSRKN